MKKRGKRIAAFLGLGFLSIVLANTLYRAYINDDGYLLYVSPYVTSNLQGLNKNPPQKIMLQKSTNHTSITEGVQLTDDRQQIEQLVSDLKWTWVTNLKKIPDEETVYHVNFTDSRGDLIYPFMYYPQSDTLVFLGRQNLVGMHSSDTLKQLLAEHISTP